MDSIRAERMARELAGTSIGSWQLGKLLGSGKSALVFRGEQPDGRTGAVKVFDPEIVERFGRAVQAERIERELSLVGKSHPNLVKITDGGVCKASDLMFVVMEVLECKNLAEIGGSVDVEFIAPIVRGIAAAAQFLEKLDLAHRDIKPDNIALNTTNMTPTLLDLGVVRPVCAAGLTDVDEYRPFLGTLQYSSPEFLLRREEDSVNGWRAVTFYQIGGVLHDLLMNRRLFAEYCNPYPLLVHTVDKVKPDLTGARGSKDLISLCQDCLVKDPELRLRVVSWDRFAQLGCPSPRSTTEVREALLRRRITAISDANGDSPDAVTLRNSQRQAAALRRSVLDDARSGAIDPDALPPVMISEDELTTESASATLTFSASPDFGLKSTVTLKIHVQFESLVESFIIVKLAASLRDGTTGTWRQGFNGTYNQHSVVQAVRNAALIAVEAANNAEPQYDLLTAFDGAEII